MLSSNCIDFLSDDKPIVPSLNLFTIPHICTTSVLGFEVVMVSICSAFQSSKFCLVKAFFGMGKQNSGL